MKPSNDDDDDDEPAELGAIVTELSSRLFFPSIEIEGVGIVVVLQRVCKTSYEGEEQRGNRGHRGPRGLEEGVVGEEWMSRR